MISKEDKILVTGGTGFLGSYLLRYLVCQGYKNIFALKRESSPMNMVLPVENDITWLTGDILEIKALDEFLKGIDFVFHCAAMVSFDPKDANKMMHVNVEGTANIVNACVENNIKKLIYVSSIAAIGRKKSFEEIDENTDWEHSRYNSKYAISKYLAEMEVWRGQAEGLNVAIVNPSVIIGAGFWNAGPAAFFKMAWKGLKFYSVGKTGWVDVRDVARYMILLMENDVVGERFILNGENLPFRNIFSSIASHLNVKKPSIKVTPLLEAISWRAAKMISIFTQRKPQITKETAQSSGRTFLYDNSKSLECFDFTYTEIEKTIKESAKVFLIKEKSNFEPGFLPLN